MKKRTEKSSNAAFLYKAYRQVHFSETQFACIPSKANTTRDLRPIKKSAPQLQTPSTFLQRPCSSAVSLSGRYCLKLSFLLFFLHSKNTYYCPISTIVKAVASEQAASSRPENLQVSCKKRGQHTYHIVRNRELCQKWDNKKNCILQTMSASRCSVTHNNFRSSLTNWITAVLEAKSQLWKLM